MTGKFIVFEGLDGSGKATQVELLKKHLEEKGFLVEKVDFPQHGEGSSYFVDTYLTGKYGTAEDVGPYRGSVFYTLDRYDASFRIKKWLQEGKFVLADRYTASNIGHQGGKIKDKEERSKYFKWLYELEYEIFGIPKPAINLILKTSPEISLRMANDIKDEEKKNRRKSYLGDDKNQDIHEKDLNHQLNTLESYLQAAAEYPGDFKIIDCLSENGELMSPDSIHKNIVKTVCNETVS